MGGVLLFLGTGALAGLVMGTVGVGGGALINILGVVFVLMGAKLLFS